MTARIRQWLEETHGDTFELVRHFLARFFDTEIGARPDDWRKVAVGVFASLVSMGILGFTTYLARFRLLQDPVNSTPQLYQAAIRNDLISLLAITMAVTALLTLLQWQSLFPRLRDLRDLRDQRDQSIVRKLRSTIYTKSGSNI